MRFKGLSAVRHNKPSITTGVGWCGMKVFMKNEKLYNVI